MKTNYLHYIVLIATIFLSSCSEEIEKELTTGKTAVIIEVDGEESRNSRTVTFPGGTAYGEGLYDGQEKPTVGAEASDGYEIDYFYGGPSSEPQKYNHTGSGGSASYQVNLGGEDHRFKCKFKEKKRTLTLAANPTSGGTVTGGGTYKVKTNIPISATAKSGYTFTGWTVTSRDAKIANASSTSTTVQLQSSNSTLTANFRETGPIANNITIYGVSKIPWGFALEIFSDYPLNSDVKIRVNVRGTWMVAIDNEGNQLREEDFPDISRTMTLPKNKDRFTLDIVLGPASQVVILASANYGPMILTDSDDKYNYNLIVDADGMIYW